VVGKPSAEHPDGTLARFTIEDTANTSWAAENQQAAQLLKLLPRAQWLEVEGGSWRTRIAVKPFAEALKGKGAKADTGRPVKERKGVLPEPKKKTAAAKSLKGAPPPGASKPAAKRGPPPMPKRSAEKRTGPPPMPKRKQK
jgi:hypothetical protein